MGAERAHCKPLLRIRSSEDEWREESREVRALSLEVFRGWEERTSKKMEEWPERQREKQRVQEPRSQVKTRLQMFNCRRLRPPSVGASESQSYPELPLHFLIGKNSNIFFSKVVVKRFHRKPH